MPRCYRCIPPLHRSFRLPFGELRCWPTSFFPRSFVANVLVASAAAINRVAACTTLQSGLVSGAMLAADLCVL